MASIVKDACKVIRHCAPEWINLNGQKSLFKCLLKAAADQQEVTVCKVAWHQVWAQFDGCPERFLGAPDITVVRKSQHS